MKKTTLCLMLVCSLGSAHAQMNQPKIDWNLKKVLWSQTHHDPLKPGKPVMDFDIVANWQSLGERVTISPNGKYVTYDLAKGGASHYGAKADQVIIQSTDGSWKQVIHPSQREIGFFTSDSKHFIYEVDKGLCIVELGTSNKETLNDFKSYLPDQKVNAEHGSNLSVTWLAFTYENKDVVLKNLVNGKEVRLNDVASSSFNGKGEFSYTTSSSPETVVYRLSDGKTRNIPAAKSQASSKDGKFLLLNQGNSLELFNVATEAKSPIWSAGEGQTIQAPSFDETGKKVIFTVSSSSGNSIWIWKESSEAKQIANQGTVKAPAGFKLQSGATFSDNGQYISYSLQKPAEKYEVPKGAVELTLWSSRDKLLQTTQMEQKEKNAPTTRKGYLRAQDGQVIYLSKQNESGFVFGDILSLTKKEETYGENATTDRFWDPSYKQVSYQIKNLNTGKTIFSKTVNNGYGMTLASSPKKDYAVYFDYGTGNYNSLNYSNGKITNLCKGLNPGHFKARDYSNPGWKQSSGPYSPVGWMQDGSGYIIYDEYDIWMLKPNGNAPVNLTNGYGRKHNINFQVEGYGNGGKPVVTDKTLLLSAFNIRTKENGFFRMTIGVKKNPEKLTMGPQFMRVNTWAAHFDEHGMVPLKASNANVWVALRHTPETGANYYITNDLKSYKPITAIRSHKNVNWYTKDLHYYKSLDGTEGEGLLFKPENFDPKKKYPVIMPFYGQYACYRYFYQDPALAEDPATLATHPAWFTSHGYIVFVPSIRVGSKYYSRTCFNALEGGAKYLRTLPFVDGDHIGAMCHSWSAKLGAYLFTHSKLVKAMWINEGYMYGDMINTAFAPTTTGPGYDKFVKSDLGDVENWEEDAFGDFWSNKESWIDQTTILNLDKSQMPLMLSCNSQDLKKFTYASQGFEIYNGLRRLNKPVWWFRYSKNCDHNFEGNEQLDITIRMTQFFDHYFKGAPAPKWMTQGIPNKLVGVESERRLELDPKGTCDPKCKVCKKRHAK